MFVEWLRECYVSKWRLFRDSSIDTVGYYYFSPPGSVAFPGVHTLGSRNWHDRNWSHDQGLGESLSSRHAHRDGEFAGILPEQVYVGDLEDFANGVTLDDAVDVRELYNGYPEGCYIPPGIPELPPAPIPPAPPVPDFGRISTFTRCPLQRLWARVIELMYLNKEADIQTLLAAFLSGPATVTFHAEQGNMPALTTVVTPDWCAICADGTRNSQQLAMQAFQGLSAPTNFGAWGTLPLWFAAAQYAHSVLVADGVNDNRPVFLAGHSYGAAAMLNLAALYRHWANTRTVKYMAFGCPKIGDERLVSILRRVDGIALANSNDIVTAVPPTRSEMAPLFVLFPLLNFGPFFQWERNPHQVLQTVEGQLEPGPPIFLDYQTLLTLVTRVVLAQEQEVVLGHAIDEYQRRIALRCPDAQWPVDQEVIDLIEEDVDTGGGLVFGGIGGVGPGSGNILFGGATFSPPANGGLLFGGG